MYLPYTTSTSPELTELCNNFWKHGITMESELSMDKHLINYSHQGSLCLRNSGSTTGYVGEMLSSQLAKQHLECRKCFLKLLSNTRSFQDKVLHFMEMTMNQILISCNYWISALKMRVTLLVGWSRRQTKWDGKVMALHILRMISINLQSTSFHTVMLDEITDVANVEKFVLCLGWVSEFWSVWRFCRVVSGGV